MVTVFLRGGLGNQMFQYALGLNLAEKNKTGLLLDTVFLRDRFPRKEFAYRNYDLDIFSSEPHLTQLSRTANALPLPGVWLGIDLAGIKMCEVLGGRKLVREKDDDFDAAVLGMRGDLILFGRWQSEKYFRDIADKVRQAFRFRQPFAGEAAALAEQIAATASVSLHVRRGDFGSIESVIKLMGGTDLSYYARAAAYVAERVPAPHFFVFSDDVAWCRDNLKIPFPATYVSESAAGPKQAFHFELMSLCKHNVIANSTFSWWAAWLNENPGKIVIAPKRWYADGLHSDADIVPESWMRL